MFGPHPDDIEIGLGGTIARHTAEGRVGRPVRSDRRPSSRATARRTSAATEADARPRVLGARWRENLGWPDGGIAATPPMIRSAVDLIRRAAPAHDRDSLLGRSPSRTTSRRARCCARRFSRAACAATRPTPKPWRPDWVCYYFINDGATPSFVVDVSAHYQRKRDALDCYRSQFSRPATERSRTRLTRVVVPTVDREPRRAVRRACRRGVRRGRRRPRADRPVRAC